MTHTDLADESARLIKTHKALLLDAVASVQADYHLFVDECDTRKSAMKLVMLDRSVERLEEAIRVLKNEIEAFNFHTHEANNVSR